MAITNEVIVAAITLLGIILGTMQKKSDAKVEEVHVLVNNRSLQQDEVIKDLRASVKRLEDLLDKSNGK